MRRGYIILKSTQARKFAKTCRSIDDLTWRLSILRLSDGWDNYVAVSLSLHDLYEDALKKMHDSADSFCVSKGKSGEAYYRLVIKNSNHGNRRRMNMKTDLGKKLYRLCLSIDRMCIVVGMLAAERVITTEQARVFYKTVVEVAKDFSSAHYQLNAIHRYAEKLPAATVQQR